MAVTAFDYAPRTVSFSDAAVFGRVTSAFQAYLDGWTDEAEAAKSEERATPFLGSIREYFARRATVMQLSALSDKQLADMGIARDQIEAVVAASR